VSLLDRYVLLRFLKTYAMVVIVVLLLFIVIDMTNRVRRFRRAACGTPVATGTKFCPRCKVDIPEGGSRCPQPRIGELLVQYYVANTPIIYYDLAPFLIVLTGMLTISHMRAENELIPMMVAGRSPPRIVLPILIAGIALGVGAWSVQEHLIPQLGRLIESSGLVGKRVLQYPEAVPDNTGGILLSGGYTTDRKILHELWYLRLDESGREVYEIIADQGTWFEDQGHWLLTNGVMFHYNAKGQRPLTDEGKTKGKIFGAEGIYLDSPIRPRDILGATRRMSSLSSSQLREQRDTIPKDQARVSVLLETRRAYPLAGFILLLLGLPFVLDTGGSTWVGLIFALIICGSYYALSFILIDLGKAGSLNPIAVAWIPNAVFLTAGFGLLWTKAR